MGWDPYQLAYYLNWNTLQGINISHLGKRKIIFKMPFFGDMLVPWRVILRWWTSDFFFGGEAWMFTHYVFVGVIRSHPPNHELNVFDGLGTLTGNVSSRRCERGAAAATPNMGFCCTKMCTLPKFNMEPGNQPLEKEIPIGNHHFEVPC